MYLHKRHLFVLRNQFHFTDGFVCAVIKCGMQKWFHAADDGNMNISYQLSKFIQHTQTLS